MSASPGKVGILGTETVRGRGREADERVFALTFWQARDPAWIGRVFFARYDPAATWWSELRPAFGEREFFFESGYREMVARMEEGASGQLLQLGW